MRIVAVIFCAEEMYIAGFRANQNSEQKKIRLTAVNRIIATTKTAISFD